MLCKLQHSQRGRNQINGTKTPSFAVFKCVPVSWWRSEWRGTMSALLYGCVSAKRSGRIKGSAGQTPVMWFLTSSTPDGERAEDQRQEANKRLHTDTTRWPLYPVMLMRTSQDMPAGLHLCTSTSVSDSFMKPTPKSKLQIITQPIMSM